LKLYLIESQLISSGITPVASIMWPVAFLFVSITPAPYKEWKTVTNSQAYYK